MTWDTAAINNLILIGKDVGVHLTQVICRKLDLGQPINIDLEYLYLLVNIVTSLEHRHTTVYADAQYSQMNEMINRIEIHRNKYRGL